MNRRKLEKLFKELGFQDFRWLNPKDIKVAHWVRMKCQFGCDAYGTKACCPPNMPSKVECEEFFSVVYSLNNARISYVVCYSAAVSVGCRRIGRIIAGQLYIGVD